MSWEFISVLIMNYLILIVIMISVISEIINKCRSVSFFFIVKIKLIFFNIRNMLFFFSYSYWITDY